MIPKIIHYCWFGRGAMPDSAFKCIDSWKRFLPDYAIKLWNEDNFDVNMIPYTQEAYLAKKYAFVSDFARFWILYNWGGLYFDTDVEIIRPIDDIIERGPFMGCEKDINSSSINNPQKVAAVAPGLGLGATAGLKLYKEIIEYYSAIHFNTPQRGSQSPTTIVEHTTRILRNHGLGSTNGIQQCAEVWIYPKEYFAPKDVDTHKLDITPNTRAIHHYDASWAEWYDKAAGERGLKLKRVFGNGLGNLLNVIIYTLQKDGLLETLRKIIKKII